MLLVPFISFDVGKVGDEPKGFAADGYSGER
jgi:hypothetical protein